MGYRRQNYVIESVKYKTETEIFKLNQELEDKKKLLEILDEIQEMVRLNSKSKDGQNEKSKN